MVTRGRYIEDFIIYGMEEATWLGEKVRVWEGAVEMLEGVAHWHP